MTSSEYADMTGAFPVAAQQSGDHIVGATPFPGALQGQAMLAPPPLPPQGPPQYTAPPQSDPYAPTASWSNPYEDFVAPSGQRCLLKKLSLEDLVAAGLLDKMDALGGIVDNEVLRPAQGQPPVDVRKALKNPAMVQAFLPLLDKVLGLVVVKPTLHPRPADNEPRVEGRAYIDAVSLTDKVAIFNRAAGDLEDLKSLRQGSN